MIPQKKRDHFSEVKIQRLKQSPGRKKVLKTKESSPERHLMIKKMRTSLKMGVQLGESIQVVMVILVKMEHQIKVGNHPGREKNHQMGSEE